MVRRAGSAAISKRIVILSVAVALLSTLGQLSSTIFTPLSAMMAADFEVPIARIPDLVSVFLISFAFSQLISGPLGELIGYRKSIYLSIFIFSLASMFAAFATTYEDLVLARILQGLGAGPALILSRAVLTNSISQRMLTTAFAIQNLVFAVVPALSPIMGAWVGTYYGWRAVFFVTAALAILIGVITSPALANAKNETSINNSFQKHYPAKMVAFWAILGGIVYAPVFVSGALLPALLADTLQIAPHSLGLITAGGVVSFVLGGAIAAMLERDYSGLGIFEFLVLVLLFLLGAPFAAYLAQMNLSASFSVALIYFSIVYAGGLMTVSVSKAMHYGRRYAAITSALLGFCHLSLGAIYLTMLTRLGASLGALSALITLTVLSGFILMVIHFILKERVWSWKWGIFKRNLATGEYLLPLGLFERIKEIKKASDS
jgi:MFS family permease